MTDTKALIAEARRKADFLRNFYGKGGEEDASLYRRLADALEATELPEGWRVTEITHTSGAVVREGKLFGPFASLEEARDAMNAMEEATKPPPTPPDAASFQA